MKTMKAGQERVVPWKQILIAQPSTGDAKSTPSYFLGPTYIGIINRPEDLRAGCFSIPPPQLQI